MAVTALGPEIQAELRAACPTDALPTVLDDLSLIIDREPLTDDGEVPGSTAVWVGRLRKIAGTKLNLWGLSALVDDTQLLISELVTNGFRHGTQRQASPADLPGTAGVGSGRRVARAASAPGDLPRRGERSRAAPRQLTRNRLGRK